jgi:hypothetical protein
MPTLVPKMKTLNPKKRRRPLGDLEGQRYPPPKQQRNKLN